MSLRRLLIAPIGGLIIAASAIGTGAAPAHASAYDNISYDTYICIGGGGLQTCENLTGSEYVAPGTQKTQTFTGLQANGLPYVGGSVDLTVRVDGQGNPTMQISRIEVFDLLT